MQTDPTVADHAPTDPSVVAGTDDSHQVPADLLVEELLVEEISIDGMCGVY